MINLQSTLHDFKHVKRYRTSKVALGLKFFVFAVVTYVVLAILAYLRNSGITILPSVESLALSYKALCVLCFLELTRRYYDNLYIFSKDRMLQLGGLISIRFLKRSITYADIRETSVKQGIFGRIFNYGTLEFGTAASDDYELSFKDIGAPYRLLEFAQQIISKSRLAEHSHHDDINRPDD